MSVTFRITMRGNLFQDLLLYTFSPKESTLVCRCCVSARAILPIATEIYVHNVLYIGCKMSEFWWCSSHFWHFLSQLSQFVCAVKNLRVQLQRGEYTQVCFLFQLFFISTTCCSSSFIVHFTVVAHQQRSCYVRYTMCAPK